MSALKQKNPTWANYFGDFQPSLEDIFWNVLEHFPFVLQICKARPSRLLEVGCGRAYVSIFLQKFLGCAVTAIDRDPDLLERASRCSAALDAQVDFRLVDAFTMDLESGFDLAFHQGFLEHFSDADASALIDAQLRVSKLVVCSVPSKFYPVVDYGDERLLTLEQWQKALSRFRVSGFYYGSRRDAFSKAWKRRSLDGIGRVLRYRTPPQICLTIERKQANACGHTPL